MLLFLVVKIAHGGEGLKLYITVTQCRLISVLKIID